MVRLESFGVAFVREHPFGVVAGAWMPEGKDPVPEEVLARLHPAEAAAARDLRGYRQIEWAAGRLAWHAASRLEAPLLAGPAREPLAPEGLSVSVSHKDNLAVAIVGDAKDGTLGLDLERVAFAAEGVAERVLRPEEIAALPEGLGGSVVAQRFSLKEATYKAIYPHLKRHVGYKEARVDIGGHGVRVTLLSDDAAHLKLEACCDFLDGRFLSAVRCR